MTTSAPRPSPGRRRIGLLTASASRLGGGVSEMVVHHAQLIHSLGFEPVVVTLKDMHLEEDRERFGSVTTVSCSVFGPAMIGYAPTLCETLLELDLTLLHLHGIWMYPSHVGSRWASSTGRPYVISPHGMLDPWITRRGVAKKWVARRLYEHRNWRAATRMHALTDREADDIARASHRHDRAIVIPNPVAPYVGPRCDRRSMALYLGRIHPKKNIDALIDGWILAADVMTARSAELVIAGWGTSEDEAALRRKIAAVARDDIRFVGPAYGEDKARLLASARFMALPSHSEGLPVAILESWAAGTPTLMSEHCNLPIGFAVGAALNSGTAATEIAQALRTAFSMTSEAWRTMSGAATAVAADHFSIDRVTAAWNDVYNGLLDGDWRDS